MLLMDAIKCITSPGNMKTSNIVCKQEVKNIAIHVAMKLRFLVSFASPSNPHVKFPDDAHDSPPLLFTSMWVDSRI